MSRPKEPSSVCHAGITSRCNASRSRKLHCVEVKNYVSYVPFCVLCVLFVCVYCTAATGCQTNCS
jgi:hypothetical protein